MVVLVDYRNSFTVEIFCMMQGVQIDAASLEESVYYGIRLQDKGEEAQDGLFLRSEL